MHWVRSTVSDTRHEPLWSATGVRVATFLLGVVEVFLGLRLLLKLFADSTASWFVQFIYDVTHVLIMPFSGIFKTATVSEINKSQGVDMVSFACITGYNAAGLKLDQANSMLAKVIIKASAYE